MQQDCSARLRCCSFQIRVIRVHLRLILARVAQLTERWSYKPEVEGLTPSLGTKKARMKAELQSCSYSAFNLPTSSFDLSGRDSSPAER
jgi:hypothetical protein